jgi:hypothetical protein
MSAEVLAHSFGAEWRVKFDPSAFPSLQAGIASAPESVLP